MVVHVCHSVADQYVEIEWSEHSSVPNLDGIAEVLRQLPEERIELPHKVLGEHAMALKLKHEGPGMRTEARPL